MDDLTQEELNKRFAMIGVETKEVNYHRRIVNQFIMEDAFRRIKERPFRYALVTFTSMPRLWITLGSANFPKIGKVVLIFIFGSVIILTLFGAYLVRKSENAVFIGSIVIIVYYTLTFAPLNVEGRYVIPARFFSFILVSVALGYLLRRYTRLFDGEKNEIESFSLR